jgi:hypothetical protein
LATPAVAGSLPEIPGTGRSSRVIRACPRGAALYCVPDRVEQALCLGLAVRVAALAKNGQRLGEDLRGLPVEGHAGHASSNVHPNGRRPPVVTQVREEPQALLELDPR